MCNISCNHFKFSIIGLTSLKFRLEFNRKFIGSIEKQLWDEHDMPLYNLEWIMENNKRIAVYDLFGIMQCS